MREGTFNIKQFFKELAVPKAEQAEVKGCLVRGVASYYDHIYGYDKYGEYPVYMVAERMYEPYIFGFGAVEVVRRSTLSHETQLKVVQYTLQQTCPNEEYGIPHGLPALLSFLARVNALELPVFTWIMQIASIEGHLFDDWQKEEVYSLVNWLIDNVSILESEKLWWLWYVSSQCDKPQMGKPLAEYLLQHPVLSVELKRNLCYAWLSEEPVGEPPEFWQNFQERLHSDAEGLMSTLMLDTTENYQPSEISVSMLQTMLIRGFMVVMPYLKRQAVVGLVHLGEDPLSVCQTHLNTQSSSYAEAINLAVADIIREYHQTMPKETVRQLINKALKIRSINSLKAFYQLGADLFGSEYWKRAQNDTAKSIQTWAAKKVAGDSKSKEKRQGKAD